MAGIISNLLGLLTFAIFGRSILDWLVEVWPSVFGR